MNTVKDALNMFNIRDLQFQGGANVEDLQTDFFIEVMKNINTRTPTMVELGSNDSYYSIMFNKFFGNGNCKIVGVDVSDNLLKLGISNATNNNCNDITFIHAGVGRLNIPYFDQVNISEPNLQGNISNDVITVNDIMEKYNIPYIDILHMDIQGSEVSVLEELEVLKFPTSYIFISIHSNTIFDNVYEKCKVILDRNNFKYLYDDPLNGGCGDGLIICEGVRR